MRLDRRIDNEKVSTCEVNIAVFSIHPGASAFPHQCLPYLTGRERFHCNSKEQTPEILRAASQSLEQPCAIQRPSWYGITQQVT